MVGKRRSTDVEVEITLNDCHETVLFDDTRFVVLNAGRGFGKTQLSLARICKHLETEYTDLHGKPLKHKIWYIAPTLKQGKMIFWERLKDFFSPVIAIKNETETKIILLNGAEIRIVGSEQSDNLRGPYLTYAIFDEFAFHRPNYWTRIIRPMLSRVQPLGQGDFLSTPDGHNEFYQLFQFGEDLKQPEWSRWLYTSLDGGFIPEEEIEAAKWAMTTEEWLQEYFGQFIAQAGRIYYTFNREKHCKQVNQVPGLDLHWFWDFNEVPACHSGLAHVHKDKLFVFDEICTGNTEVVVEDFLKRYPKDKLMDPDTGKMPKIYLYGDVTGDGSTSGVTDYMVIEHMLTTAGYPRPELKVTTSNPLVKDRINSVRVKLKNAADEYGVVINGATCPKLVNDFEQVKYTDDGKIDKTTDRRLSHISDAFGYFIWQTYPVRSPSVAAFIERQKLASHPGGYWTTGKSKRAA